MAITSDSQVDRDVIMMKAKLEELKRTHLSLTNTFQSMPPKEKARMILAIEKTQKELTTFIEKTKTMEIFNSGTKFGIENLRQGLLTFNALWKKTHQKLEEAGFVSSSGPSATHPATSTPAPTASPDPLASATQSYQNLMAKQGHNLNSAQLQSFQGKLKEALGQAQQQFAGKSINVQVVDEGGKVKVKIVPGN